MGFTLRPYQKEAASVALAKLQSSTDRPFVIQAATGAGKSLVIADLCHQLDAPVLILQPSKELLEQNYAKLASYGITDMAVYSASMNRKEIGKFTYATIGSIYRTPELFRHFRYILVDECDAVNPKQMTTMYQKFFTAIGCRNICGLTATPYRIVTKYAYKTGELYAAASLQLITNSGGLKPFWSGGLVYSIETEALIEQGYLSPIKYRADTEALHGLVVNSTGADYTSDSLERWGERKIERMVDYIAFVDKYCKRNLVFCTSVRQAHSLQGYLADRDIEAGVVTGETPAREREELVEKYRNGEIRHMLNVGVFLAGFDVPELDCIIMARPTLSPRVWYQAIGRGVRLDPADPKKMLRVFDLAGNLAKIGPVEKLKLQKDAWGKDMLMGKHGRVDDRPLYRYRVAYQPKRKSLRR